MKTENKAPFIIAFLYAVAGALWIYLSDRWLPRFVDSTAQITIWGTYKGWFYVCVTSLLLYWLIRSYVIKLVDYQQALEKENLDCKASRAAMQESEEKFRSMVETTSDWIWEINAEDVYTYSSPKINEFLGYEPREILGRTPFELMPANEAEQLRDRFNSYKNEKKPFFAITNKNIHKDGRIIVLETSGIPVFDAQGNFSGYRGIDRDVTDHKQLEEQLLHAQKMEAVGELAGGIAHDFNNILTAITGYVYILQAKLDDEVLKNHVEQIDIAAQRAVALTNKLLTFSRKQIVCLQPVVINETLHRLEKFLFRLIREDVEIQTNYTSETLTVLGDEGQIEQVMMNLVNNARDAMPSGGVLKISSASVELGRDFIEAHGYGKPGMYALITVTDTGTGMDEKLLDRIFEPFFTTKEVDKGTGLGLAIVYGIVKQHNGFITASSEQGKGASFNVYFPLTSSTQQDWGKPFVPASAGGTGTILIAEDDRETMLFMKALFEEYGYSVIEAVDGEDAIEKFDKNNAAINLLILDMIMPKKSGKAVYEAIKKIRPDMKTIFLSGYAGDILESQGISGQDLNFFSKPVTPYKLLEKVKEMLSG
jgi:PAS domain S-box-containing protein